MLSECERLEAIDIPKRPKSENDILMFKINKHTENKNYPKYGKDNLMSRNPLQSFNIHIFNTRAV